MNKQQQLHLHCAASLKEWKNYFELEQLFTVKLVCPGINQGVLIASAKECVGISCSRMCLKSPEVTRQTMGWTREIRKG